MAAPIAVKGPAIEVPRAQPSQEETAAEIEAQPFPTPPAAAAAPAAPARPRNAAELITAAQAATTAAELDAIAALAEGRVTVLQAVQERRGQI